LGNDRTRTASPSLRRSVEGDRRKDWIEQTTTNLARRFDLIAVEDLDIKNMVPSAKGAIANLASTSPPNEG
jgi:transposase